jgi:hypothetical protein
MMHQRIWLLGGSIAFVILASFLFSVPRTTEVAEAPPSSPEVEVPRLTLKDTFRRGVHTLSGSVEAPNACAEVAASATYEESDTENAHILLAATLTLTEGLCLEILTKIPFAATVSAPANTPIVATVNGVPTTVE